MSRRSSIIALAYALPCCWLVPSVPAEAALRSQCVGKQWERDDEVRETYSRRSVQIVELALHGDINSLAPLVSPSATFAVWEADFGIGGKTGTDGAIQFATQIGVADYRYVVALSGAISSDPCGRQNVTVWFTRRSGRRAYVATFTYVKGRLVDAVARVGAFSEGKVGAD